MRFQLTSNCSKTKSRATFLLNKRCRKSSKFTHGKIEIWMVSWRKGQMAQIRYTCLAILTVLWTKMNWLLLQLSQANRVRSAGLTKSQPKWRETLSIMPKTITKLFQITFKFGKWTRIWIKTLNNIKFKFNKLLIKSKINKWILLTLADRQITVEPLQLRRSSK